MSYVIKGSDGQPVLHQGKEVYAIDLVGVVKSVDVDKRQLRIIGTDETRDRDGDIIKVSGWMLDNYLKNPVFLWAHDYRSVPLASAQKVVKRRNPASLEFHLQFPTEGLHPFADMILALYGEGVINASSVGFIPFKWEDLTDEEKEGMSPSAEIWGGKKFTKQELLELSGCAVPSNPSALQNYVKGFSEKFRVGTEQITDYILRSDNPSQIDAFNAKSDEVYEELKLEKCSFEDEADPKVHQVPEQLEFEEDTEEIPDEDISKPYPNEHACRLEDPDKFEKFRRGKREHDGKAYSVIYGKKKGEDSWAEQAYRYNKDTWTSSEARSHCKSHNGSFEAASGSSQEEPKLFFNPELLFTLKDFISLPESVGALRVVPSACGTGIDAIDFSYMNEDGVLQTVKQEVIESEDLEPEGKIGAVLSRKNREKLSQARDILDEILKEAEIPAEDDPEEENPDKQRAGETGVDLKTIQGDLETIKNIINKINKSFGG